jgi:hypothetical protein
MAGKAEISWKRRDAEGNRREVYVRHAGDRWLFFVRVQRFDEWEPLEHPPLADWLELLDAVDRRINRQLQRPEESGKIRKRIKELFPDAEIGE